MVPKDTESWKLQYTRSPSWNESSYSGQREVWWMSSWQTSSPLVRGVPRSPSSYLTPASWPGHLCWAFCCLLRCALVRTRVDLQCSTSVVCHGWPHFPSFCPAVVPPAPWMSPAVISSGTLNCRLCGVFLCQRTQQFCANSGANPMQLTLVNHNHILDCSRNQISSPCYWPWLQMELPHQLRKQLFPGLESGEAHSGVILCHRQWT